MRKVCGIYNQGGPGKKVASFAEKNFISGALPIDKHKKFFITLYGHEDKKEERGKSNMIRLREAVHVCSCPT
jgi:hypothetical protein